MKRPPPARILVVDDHPIVREGVAARIASHPDLVVCGEADSESTALKQVEELRPDLVIVDLRLRSGDGVDLIKRIRKRHPHVGILVHSMHEESLFAERTLAAGANGYLNKQAGQNSLIAAIRVVLKGKIYLSATLTDRLLKGRFGTGADRDSSSPVAQMSDRELEVYSLIGRGLTTRAIAAQLHLSVHTIETYRERLRRKLGVETGNELTRLAIQWSLEQG